MLENYSHFCLLKLYLFGLCNVNTVCVCALKEAKWRLKKNSEKNKRKWKMTKLTNTKNKLKKERKDCLKEQSNKRKKHLNLNELKRKQCT